MKKTNGITLISFVVTIIILIILAGISINMIVGNNGLFDKAKLARQEYENATDKEKQDIDNLTNAINTITGTDYQVSISTTDVTFSPTAGWTLSENTVQATLDYLYTH